MNISLWLKIRYLLEYTGLKVGLFIFDVLPLRFAESAAIFFADLYYAFSKKRRQIAQCNIKRAGIAASEKDIRKIARQSFRNFALVAVESLRFHSYINSDNWRDKVEIDVAPEVMKILSNDEQGIVLVSGHIGNWEVAGKLLSFVKPVSAIARKMNNPYAEKIMEKRSAGTRVKLIPKRGAGALTFLREIRRGNALTLLVDQHARKGGIRVDFLGIPASTYPTPAFLQLRTGVPLIFGYCVRLGPMKFKVGAVELKDISATDNRDADVIRIMELLNRELEKIIRQYPEQYLWAHRRWRDQ